MQKFLISACALFLFALCPLALRAEMQTYVIDFEQFAEAINADGAAKGSHSGWSWNNTTDRMYSGLYPEGMFQQTGTDPYMGLTEGYIEIDDVKFSHNYMGDDWGGMYYWEGTGISTVKDTDYYSYQNEMVAMPGSGVDGSETYGVIYGGGFVWENNPTIELPNGAEIAGMFITNTVYGFDSMFNGDGFATPLDEFPGKYFNLIINGYDESGELVGSVLEHLGICNNDGSTSILDEWTWLDLRSLVGAVMLEFTFDSQEDSGYGINYPTYFAFDNLTYRLDDGVPPKNPTTPEPTTLLSLLFGTGALALARRRIVKTA